MLRVLWTVLVFGLLGVMAVSQGRLAVERVHGCLGGPIRVVGVPTVDQLVRFIDGAPYVVPPGKLFVLTAIGGGDADPTQTGVQLSLDGDVEVSMRHSQLPELSAVAEGVINYVVHYPRDTGSYDFRSRQRRLL